MSGRYEKAVVAEVPGLRVLESSRLPEDRLGGWLMEEKRQVQKGGSQERLWPASPACKSCLMLALTQLVWFLSHVRFSAEQILLYDKVLCCIVRGSVVLDRRLSGTQTRALKRLLSP